MTFRTTTALTYGFVIVVILPSLASSTQLQPPRERERRAEDGSDDARVRHFAVVCCGSTHGSERHKKWYWGSNERIYKMLREVYNYPDEAIYRLHEEGKAKAAAVDGEASLENLRKVFAHLAKIMQKRDRLFVYLVGHGGPATVRFGPGGPPVKDFVYDLTDSHLAGTEFGKLLDALPSNRIVVMMNPCHSGGFISKINGKGRIICTSTKAEQSNAAGWEGYMTNALAGRGNVDANGDGRVSIKEAYNASVEGTRKYYEKKNLSLGEHPLLDDNGDGVGHFGTEAVVQGDGKRAAKTFLGREGQKLAYEAAALKALKKTNRRLQLK